MSKVGTGQVGLTDPIAMRALAHPLRLNILRLLARDGPATATQVAAWVHVSVPSASYHLHQLAKYGFVEDAATAGQGRERPWRARVRGVRWSAGLTDPGHVEASRMLREELITHALGALTDFHRNEDDYSADWQDAAFVLADSAQLTAEELREINETIRALFARYRERPPGNRPIDAVPVRLFGFGVPEANLATPTRS